MNGRHILCFVGLAVTLTLGGCGVFQETAKREQAAESHYATSQTLLEKQKDDAQQRRPFVRVRDDQWVDTTPVVASRKKLPDAIDCRVTYSPQTSTGVYELTQAIQEECHVSVRLSSDAVEYLWSEDDRSDEGEGNGRQANYPQYSSGSGATGQAADDILMQSLGLSGDSPLGARTIGDLTWDNEPLEDLLDGFAANLGLSWRYEENDGEIVLYHVTSRSYAIHTLSTNTDMTSTVSTGTSLGSTGAEGTGESVSTGTSESGQETTVSLSHEFTDEFRATVESMLSTNGTYSFSPSMAQLSVKDTPDVLDEIQEYVDQENSSLGKQVLLDVKVYSVTLDDSDSFGIDWDLIYQSATEQVGLQSAFSEIASSAGSGSIHLIDGDSRWNASQLIFNALSEQGRVSTVASPSAVTTNLQPTPVQAARQVGYLAESSVTNTEGGQSTQEAVQGTVNVGLNMTALPYIIDQNEMLLQFSLEMSTLRDLRPVESGDSRIEIPELDSRIFSQRVRLNNGETLVLSGFEQEKNNTSRQGMGYARNFLTGGGLSSESSREIIVILITPTFMNDIAANDTITLHGEADGDMPVARWGLAS